MGDVEKTAAQVIAGFLKDAELEWESPDPGAYVIQLPGTRKLKTTVSLIVGRHSLSLNAFVIRHPDENESGVHRWLLERNLKLYGVSYAVDRLGDVYVTARLPLATVTADEIDRLMGQVLEAADGAFNTLLELGFASAIRREYEWRVSRGEPTRNLDAFAHLTQRPADPTDSARSPDPADPPGSAG
ncbi:MULTISPECIES: YbjN domain-containing protein [unclassified Streptomyces]|uniref:YbjN domain-containing protein n=1 Tax=unclassified Streptomyces TaxID=2593676 RepID=UPI003825BB47